MSNLPPSGEIPRGAIRFNTDSNKPELWDGSQWAEFQLSTPNLGRSVDTQPGARGLSGGGYSAPGRTNVINYFNIASTGNALDFGDLFTGSYGYAVSSSTRGIWGGGAFDDGGGVSNTNRIEFVTISSTGNGTDFGDLLAAKSQMNQGCSNATRGLFSGGGPQPSRINTIEYITMSSAGNAQDFGDLTRLLARAGSVSSPTRGIFAGGTPAANGDVSNIIDFVTISTLGNSQDFGDLTFEKTSPQSCSNAIRGLFGGSGPPPASNVIDYITISSTGNAVKFGELTDARFFGGACSSSTNGVFVGGYNEKVTIDYVKIATEGNAVDFGDLPDGVSYNAAVSNAHGGL